MLRLPEEARQSLKRPLGKLFRSTEDAVKHIRRSRPARLIAVGDVVTAELLSAGLKPDVVVVDFMVMRFPASDDVRGAIDSYSVPEVKVENSAGAITPELQDALEKAEPPVKIIVEGEEDLATIPAVLTAPEGSVVAYGQPGEGMVLIEVSEQKKREFKKILNLFEPESLGG